MEDAKCSSFNTPFKVYYKGGDTSGFQDQLNSAINQAIKDGKFNYPGVYEVNGPNGDRGTNTQEEGENGLGTAGIVVISGLAVALVILAVITLKRRRRTEDESLVEQVKSTDLLLDDDMTHDSSEPGHKTRIVGDSNSLDDVFDGIDDSLTLTSTSLGGAHPAMDVHVCQSSLCEVCEERNRNPISFVRIGAPSSPPRIPDDASRSYAALNTVSL